MRLSQLALSVIVFSLPVSDGASAELNQWGRTHPSGPEHNLGGRVRELSTSADGVTYIKSRFNRFYSRPNAASVWENYVPIVNGQPRELFNYFPDPTIAGLITANRSNGSVLRSFDYGRTWETVTSQNDVDLIARSTSDPAIFYASESFSGELQFSSDYGFNWSTIPLPDFSGVINDLEIDPNDPNILYALDGSRIKKSLDGGGSWQVMDEGTGSFWYMQDLAIDPVNTQNVYAASGGSTYVFRTNDAASNWNLIELPNPPDSVGAMHAVKVDPANSEHVFAVGDNSSLYASNDSGATWSAYNDPAGTSDWHDVTISNLGDVVVSGSAGTAVPLVSGVVELTNQGYSDFEMKLLAQSSGDARFTYAGGVSGLAVYDRLSDTWSLRDRPFGSNVRGIAVDPLDSRHIVVASFGGDVYESMNAGLDWQEILIPADDNLALDIAMAPSNTDVLYLRTERGIYRSDNNGSDWEFVLEFVPTTAGVKYPMVVSPTNSDIVHIGTSSFGLYTSQNGGETWSTTADLLLDNSISGIAIDPRNSSTVYATSYSGNLIQSVDSGITWTEFDTTGTGGQFRALAVDSLVAGRLFVQSSFDKVYVYEPSQQAWSQLGSAFDRPCGQIA